MMDGQMKHCAYSKDYFDIGDLRVVQMWMSFCMDISLRYQNVEYIYFTQSFFFFSRQHDRDFLLKLNCFIVSVGEMRWVCSFPKLFFFLTSLCFRVTYDDPLTLMLLFDNITRKQIWLKQLQLHQMSFCCSTTFSQQELAQKYFF